MSGALQAPNPGAAAIGIATSAGVTALVYEAMLVALEMYGYGMSESSCHFIFAGAIVLGMSLFALTRGMIQALRAAAIPGRGTALLLTGAGSLLAWYLSWAADRWLRLGLMGKEGAGFNPSPVALWEYVQRFHHAGFWGWGYDWYERQTTVKGSTLTWYWALEAAFLLLLPPWIASRRIGAWPSCARCNTVLQWFRNVRRLQASRAPRALEQLPAGDYSVFAEPRTPGRGDPYTLQVDVHKCEYCADQWFVTLILDGKVLLQRTPAIPENALKVWPPVAKRQ